MKISLQVREKVIEITNTQFCRNCQNYTSLQAGSMVQKRSKTGKTIYVWRCHRCSADRAKAIKNQQNPAKVKSS